MRRNTKLNVFLCSTVACGLLALALAGTSQADQSSDTGTHHRLDRIAALFDKDALVGVPKLVECTLSGGTERTCFLFTLKKAPKGIIPGPWCPRNIKDGPEQVGIWLESGQVYDVDGDFIQGLATFYDDKTWQLFDQKTGAVHVTDTKESCNGAARPDVDPRYYNHCVECQTSYLDGPMTMTYIIPVEPVRATKVEGRVNHEGAGITFSGLRLDGPAPVEAILGAHTIAPFDDCGGHVNLHAGYHIHAVTDCAGEVSTNDTIHAPLIGIAMDGYKLHAQFNRDGDEPDDLDRCRGHETPTLGYHYHAGAPGDNAILQCHTGETGCANQGADTQCDATNRHRPSPD